MLAMMWNARISVHGVFYFLPSSWSTQALQLFCILLARSILLVFFFAPLFYTWEWCHSFALILQKNIITLTKSTDIVIQI